MKKIYAQAVSEKTVLHPGAVSHPIFEEGAAPIPGCFTMLNTFTNETYNTPGIHSDNEGFYVISGAGHLKIAYEEYTLGPGTAMFAPAGMPHAIKKTGKDDLVIFIYHFPYVKPHNHFSPEEALNRISPEDMGLVYTSVQRIEMNAESSERVINSQGEELCLVVTSGSVEYSIEGQKGSAIFRDMLYIPANNTIILCSSNAVLAMFGATSDEKTHFAHIPFAKVDSDERHKIYGKEENGTKREVWNYIDENFNSGRFLTGICRGTAGGWTAWPPHEHGAKREEVYVYFDMGENFGIQCVYDDYDELETAEVVKDGHIIAIPGGYHPNCGCPGGGLSYIYCMVSVTANDRNFMDLQTQKLFGDKLE